MATMEPAEGVMLESDEAEGVMLESDEAFPAVEIEKELNPGLNTEVEVDPISAQVAADVDSKERAEAVKQKRDKDRCDAMRTLKSAIVISAAIAVVAGAAFAITKKLREK